MTKPQTVMNRVGLTELPESMQAGWHQAMDLTGDATFIEVSGNNPDVYSWYLKDFYQKLFYSNRIETTLVELVRLRLANVHGCAFCNKGDTAHALRSGITQAQIRVNICPLLEYLKNRTQCDAGLDIRPYHCRC